MLASDGLVRGQTIGEIGEHDLSVTVILNCVPAELLNQTAYDSNVAVLGIDLQRDRIAILSGDVADNGLLAVEHPEIAVVAQENNTLARQRRSAGIPSDSTDVRIHAVPRPVVAADELCVALEQAVELAGRTQSQTPLSVLIVFDLAALPIRVREAKDWVVPRLSVHCFEQYIRIAHEIRVFTDGLKLAVVADEEQW